MLINRHKQLEAFGYNAQKWGGLALIGQDYEGTVNAENPEKALDHIVKKLFRHPDKVNAKVEIFDMTSGKLLAQWKSKKWVVNEYTKKVKDMQDLTYVKRTLHGSKITVRALKELFDCDKRD